MEVQLISYHNPTSEDCNGGNCEGTLSGICDNKFSFCLRPVENGASCLATISTNHVSDDSITFDSSDLSRLGIRNPLVFTSISTAVSVFFTHILLFRGKLIFHAYYTLIPADITSTCPLEFLFSTEGIRSYLLPREGAVAASTIRQTPNKQRWTGVDALWTCVSRGAWACWSIASFVAYLKHYSSCT